MGQCLGYGSYGHTLGDGNTSNSSPNATPESREARAQAALERIEKQNTRGVQKGGGNLQKKLEQKQKEGGTSSGANAPVTHDGLAWKMDA
jgi:hypothetical protein